jgi:hypothetical protein
MKETPLHGSFSSWGMKESPLHGSFPSWNLSFAGQNFFEVSQFEGLYFHNRMQA